MEVSEDAEGEEGSIGESLLELSEVVEVDVLGGEGAARKRQRGKSVSGFTGET